MDQNIIELSSILLSQKSSAEKDKIKEKTIRFFESSDMVKSSTKLKEIFRLKDKNAASKVVQEKIEELYVINLRRYKLDEDSYERLAFATEYIKDYAGADKISRSLRKAYGIEECHFLVRAMVCYMNVTLKKRGI